MEEEVSSSIQFSKILSYLLDKIESEILFTANRKYRESYISGKDLERSVDERDNDDNLHESTPCESEQSGNIYLISFL